MWSSNGRGQRQSGWDSHSRCWNHQRILWEAQDHEGPEDILDPVEGESGFKFLVPVMGDHRFESHLPTEESPKVLLINAWATRVAPIRECQSVTVLKTFSVFLLGRTLLLCPWSFVMFVFTCICVSHWPMLWDRWFLPLSLSLLPGREHTCLTIFHFWLYRIWMWGKRQRMDGSSEERQWEWSGWERLATQAGACGRNQCPPPSHQALPLYLEGHQVWRRWGSCTPALGKQGIESLQLKN